MTDVVAEILRLEQLMVKKDELNHTLMQATTAYQIRMAGQEYEIYDKNKEIEDLRAGKELLTAIQMRDLETLREQDEEIAKLKTLVKKLTIRVVELQVEE